MAKRILRCDLRTNAEGVIHGPLLIGDDSLAVLEAVYCIIEQLSENSGVAPKEIAADLYRLAAGKVT